jgi:hypothetical protein
MADPVLLPAMLGAQEQAWLALMDLHERVDSGWTLIGGQLVHLHCAERGISPTRPTSDIDTVVDVRAAQDMLETFTGALVALGFAADTSGDGVQHRWKRDLAQVDVLIPEGVGERAAARRGAGGGPTVPAPGATQALARTESVVVQIGDRVGTVLRPNLVGALVAKAAARIEIIADRARARHCTDFVVLANLIAASDFRETVLNKKDKQRLRKMVTHCRADAPAMLVENAAEALDQLERAAKLNG